MRRRGWQRMRWLDGISVSMEFEQAPALGDGQGSLACCTSWDWKESDTTEWLNWTAGYIFSLWQSTEMLKVLQMELLLLASKSPSTQAMCSFTHKLWKTCILQLIPLAKSHQWILKSISAGRNLPLLSSTHSSSYIGDSSYPDESGPVFLKNTDY